MAEWDPDSPDFYQQSGSLSLEKLRVIADAIEVEITYREVPSYYYIAQTAGAYINVPCIQDIPEHQKFLELLKEDWNTRLMLDVPQGR